MALRLIALDIDGTLLDSQKTITPACAQAVRAAMSQGVRVTLISSRSYCRMASLASELGLQGYVAALDGSDIREVPSGARVASRSIPPGEAMRVVRICEQRNILCALYSNDTLYIERRSTRLAIFRKEKPFFLSQADKFVRLSRVEPLLRGSAVAVQKMLLLELDPPGLAGAWEEIRGIRDVAAARADNHLGEEYISIVAAGTDKGSALRFICARCGIELRDSLAIGDDWNDTPMLQEAGVAVAMGNAGTEVKRIACHVTEDNDHDGVARAIMRFL